MKPQKASVLLMAYGSVQDSKDIPAFLQDLRGGQPVDPRLVEEIREHYRAIGGRSPFLEITLAQAKALQERLEREEGPGTYKVYVGMRHSSPSIPETVRTMQRIGKTTEGNPWVVAVTLPPYYSKFSVDANLTMYHDSVKACGARFSTLEVETWSSHPLYLKAWAVKIQKALALWGEKSSKVQVLFTAHSLPARILNDGDPYPNELSRAVGAVARLAGLSSWEFAYQSRGRTRESWLGPDAGETIERLAAAGCKDILLVPIGFITDNLETLYDNDILHRKQATRLGIHFERAECLNCDPLLIDALADVVLQRVLMAEHPSRV